MDELSGGALRSLNAAVDAGFPIDGETASELFVINLCASMTPMTVASKGLNGFEQYKLYQVSRIEDGRRRFRLRLGFFPNESAAEIVLNSVRSNYPTAFAACLCDEDMRHAPAGHRKPALATGAATSKPVISAAANISIPTPAPATASTRSGSENIRVTGATVAASSVKLATAPVAGSVRPSVGDAVSVAPQSVTQITLSAELPPPSHVASTGAVKAVHDVSKVVASTHSAAALNAANNKASGIELASEPAKPAAAQAAAAPKRMEGFHVAAGITVPPVDLELVSDAPAAQAKPAAIAPPQKTLATAPVSAPSSATPSAAHRSSVFDKAPTQQPPLRPQVGGSMARTDMIPVLDSTQTIRTLTADECNDESQPKWFAVELTISDQPVNLDAMPRLDIFAAYCLYSVAMMEEGKIRHALRLGFFKEEVSADAVSGYLKTFFPLPQIMRISSAEYKRFAERPAPKAAPEAPRANVVKIDDARERTAKEQVPSTIAPEAPKNADSTGRFPALKTASDPKAPSKVAARSTAQAVKRSPASPNQATAKGKSVTSHTSLNQQLREEARQVVLSESGLHKQSSRQGSLLSRLVGKLKS